MYEEVKVDKEQPVSVPFIDEEWSRLSSQDVLTKDGVENKVNIAEGSEVVGIYGYIIDSTHI